MAELKALNPVGLSANFNLEEHGEKPIISLSFRDSTIRLVYRFPGYSQADLPGEAGQSGFQHEVGIHGTGFLSESGKPLLPSFGRFLQIPPGYAYQVRVKKSGLRKRKNMKIRPAQENATDQDPWTFEFDSATYDQDHYYPEETVAVSRPFYMDGYRTLCIHVRPLQYNPARQLLRCYSTIEVTIALSAEKAPRQSGRNKDEVPLWAYLDQKHNLEGFGNFLFNPERYYFSKAGLQAPKRKIAHRRADTPDFLILYGEALQKPAQRLQAWKQKCGLTTAIVPVAPLLAPLGTNSTRADQVQAIKTYIRKMRAKPGSPLRYVLLFGDIAAIPSEERPRPGTAATGQCDTTDLYYFTHRDAEGADCLVPWVAGGRIAAREEAEGLAVVEQIIHYEKSPPEDPDYFARMTVAAYFEDKDRLGRQDGRANQAYLKTMETIRDHMVSHGFEVQRVYVSNNRTPAEFSDGTPVPPKLREELIYKTDGPLATKKLMGLINTGQLIIGHRGHGDQLGWLNPPLRTADIQSIAGTTPSVFFSISCRTGSFDGARECFAEELLAMNGGAPSLIAATEL
ncbi:MAG: C25 family cysteine peptidase, partial [Desulfobacteraceae bacterium]|nr:C25 family cysteine peptidase [Desulfobacteraceae bacterium]